MKNIAIQQFEKVTGWKATYAKEYAKNSFLIIANGQSTTGQSFRMVLTSTGWNLDAI